MVASYRAWRYIPKNMKRSLPFLIIVLVLVAAAALAYFLFRKSGSANETNLGLAGPNQNSQTGPSTSNSGSLTTNPSTVAKPNVKVSSPVLIEEYGDYQCPPCGKLYPEMKKIEDEYGTQIHFVFHHFPLSKVHKNAMAAARAAEAARLQNKFWEMHDRLYRNQSLWAEAADPRPIFITFAQQLGLNVEQFQSDMESNRVEQAISTDMQRALSLGINGTPTLIMDGQILSAEATTPEGIRRGINVMLERKAIS
jgi:protein-disulfide isomerase